MIIRHGAWITACLVLLSLMITGGSGPSAGVYAAPAAQPTLVLGAEAPLTGTLDDATPVEMFTFQCFAGGIASVYVETTAGDLVIDSILTDQAGNLLATGQLVQATPAITIAEGFVMPDDGPCTLTLTRAGSTTGSYALRLLPGYAMLDKWEAFDGTGGPLHMKWLPYLSDSMEADIRDQRLAITVMEKNVFGFIIPEDLDIGWHDLYIQADFLIEGEPTYFEYGFLLRSDLDGDRFYSLGLSSDSDWSYYFFDHGWDEIQPWTVSPVLDGTDQKPRLGVLLRGHTAQVFYNHRYVGEVTDPDRRAAQGIIGVSLSTGVNQRAWLTGHVDNLIITRPWGSSGG